MRVLLLAFFTLYIGNIFSQTISEIQGEADSSPFLEQSVTTSGIVTGISNEGYFIQDGIGEWTGLYVFDSTEFPEIGDEISVTGTVDEFYGFTELENITEFTVLSTNNPLPAATELSTSEITSEAYESVLVQVNMAECTNPDLGFNEFELNDGSGPCSVDDFIFFYTPSLGVHYAVTGPLYYSYGDFKILPRDINDVVIDEPLYFTQDPEETIIDVNTLTIEWQTNAESETRLLYGTTPSYELGDIELTEMTTEHLIELSDLQAATVYYVAAVSSDGVNMTPVKEWVVCTKSESTGTIDVFFNHPVNTSVATETEAIYNPDFTGLYVEYIESATQTLDIAMYDWHEIPSALIDAINTAHAQGILVRIVTDSEIENTALADLASALPVVFGTDEGIMHDKFLIIDVDLITAKVVGGSTNWTDSNLGWDFNNIVTIE
ncbi:MAG: phospholipase D-like domain-containing protein, partial [Flavobacteriales bacterium]